jgi:3-methyladenine DNA glycosylase AlkD
LKASEVRASLKAVADPEKAAFYPRFFKAGKGEYAEGDRFLGVVVPEQRRVARQYSELSLSEVGGLLRSPIHEYRNTALLILAEKVRRGDDETAENVYELVMRHVDRINHWDLVDLAAPKLIGPRLRGRPQRMKLLDEFAASPDLWRRRIAIMSTFPFVQRCEFGPTLRLADRLLDDAHDLIHKAVGWMLREVGNRDRQKLLRYLDRRAARMPRTMLRYAIEKLPESRRQRYLKAGA